MAMASCSAAATTRRQKIEMKKVEQRSKRHVTFSKRKLGLFNKLTELSILCHAETALIIISPNGNLYSAGYPDADTVLRRYITGGSPSTTMMDLQSLETFRLEYEATQNEANQEKKRLQEMKEEQKDGDKCSFPCWWNQSVEEIDNSEDVEQFKVCLESLKINLVAAVEQKMMMMMIPQTLQDQSHNTIPPNDSGHY
ncbi:hypothetical protein RJT34_08553 [Clitoria ternatea]|uniref:MADS-box domain-containing protein n=1 Tax=Clitoria ternatea TaxID=43366 RepID=A0AAN9K3W5_CLITE